MKNLMFIYLYEKDDLTDKKQKKGLKNYIKMKNILNTIH